MKMKAFHSRWLGMLGALALVSSACSDDGQPSLDGGTDGTESADGGSMTGPSNTTTGATSDDPSSTTTGATSSNDDSNFIDPADDDDGPGEPGPNGSECSANAECTSGYCYIIPAFGGICSECLMDADCGEGTCSVDFGAGYAVCTDGSLGKMCDTDEGCQGELVCAQLIDTGGLFNASFCSECNDDTPCEDDDICSPHYDEGSISGHMACVEPGSVPDGQGCPIGNDAACQNGHCGVASLMGFVEFGVCGECSTNEDCEGGETCTPASVSQQNGLQGASCG